MSLVASNQRSATSGLEGDVQQLQRRRRRRRRNHDATCSAIKINHISMVTLVQITLLSCSMLRTSLAFTFHSKIGSMYSASLLCQSISTSSRSRIWQRATSTDRRQESQASAAGRLNMVRNIDLVECLIFYGQDSILLQEYDGDHNPKFSLLPGVQSLVKECQGDDTAVIALIEREGSLLPSTTNSESEPSPAHVYLSKLCPTIHTYPMTRPAPNPKDIWCAIHSIPPVQPKGFGGSSGFGTKAADPERAPLSKHSVVLCSTEHQCRAARYAGMRVLCLHDNALADAVLDYDWSTLYMDDIATPGSFWLNPPHPRDDESNAVEIESVIQAYEHRFEEGGGGDDSSSVSVVLSATEILPDDEQLSDAELAKILADIDPL